MKIDVKTFFNYKVLGYNYLLSIKEINFWKLNGSSMFKKSILLNN